MTCKDCVHYEVCEDLRYGDISNCNVKDCGGFFKNKADFVKVVRCRECIYYFPPFCNRPRNKPNHTHCFLTNDFCSYGERSDT